MKAYKTVLTVEILSPAKLGHKDSELAYIELDDIDLEELQYGVDTGPLKMRIGVVSANVLASQEEVDALQADLKTKKTEGLLKTRREKPKKAEEPKLLKFAKA